ncbi:hypothetical protein BDV95DRAFT_585048 [Massariosphaeria phaeospora]|uniref:Uncharacterized protein n=1 Tax=Massariosphaeria phaeospora TaxID=100035 RepID=A0A7C8M1U6_9PLEO|nr:hypothetical protein BDV95DRAFT_585048 [Massariosphaeria phaeospora]
MDRNCQHSADLAWSQRKRASGPIAGVQRAPQFLHYGRTSLIFAVAGGCPSD